MRDRFGGLPGGLVEHPIELDRALTTNGDCPRNSDGMSVLPIVLCRVRQRVVHLGERRAWQCAEHEQRARNQCARCAEWNGEEEESSTRHAGLYGASTAKLHC